MHNPGASRRGIAEVYLVVIASERVAMMILKLHAWLFEK